MKKSTEIIVEHNVVTILTLKGSNDLNILNYQAIISLYDTLKELDKDKSIEALIITGNGNKAFCSGADISELSSIEEDAIEEYVEVGFKTFNKIENFHSPVIASVNGYAFGAAFELLLSCDIRIMSSSAIIGQPAVTHGLIPPFGGLHRLPDIVGLGVAKYIVYSAKNLSADECLKMGLVNDVFKSDNLLKESINLANKIIKGKDYSLSFAKNLLNNHNSRNIEQLEKKALMDCLKNQKTKNQLNHFFDKNKLKNKNSSIIKIDS